MADTLSLRWIGHDSIIRSSRGYDNVAEMENGSDNAEEIELFSFRESNDIKAGLGRQIIISSGIAHF